MCRIARDLAKVVDQVRLLARTLGGMNTTELWLESCWMAHRVPESCHGIVPGDAVGGGGFPDTGVTVCGVSLECAGSHATLRRLQTRFDSWRGH